MSLLTFLFFASVVYLCAVADPIAESPAAVTDQDRLDNFMAAVEKSYDEEIALLLAGLSEDDRDYMKVITLDGVGGFINYCVIRAREQADGSIDKALENDDIYMQFDSEDSFLPAVTYTQPPASSQNAKNTD